MDPPVAASMRTDPAGGGPRAGMRPTTSAAGVSALIVSRSSEVVGGAAPAVSLVPAAAPLVAEPAGGAGWGLGAGVPAGGAGSGGWSGRAARGKPAPDRRAGAART